MYKFEMKYLKLLKIYRNNFLAQIESFFHKFTSKNHKNVVKLTFKLEIHFVTQKS